MTHHIDYAFTVLGGLMLVCAIGSWRDAWRRNWKPSRTVDSAGYTLFGIAILLDGVDLRSVSSGLLIGLLVVAVCLSAIGFVLFKIESKRTPRPTAHNQAST